MRLKFAAMPEYRFEFNRRPDVEHEDEVFRVSPRQLLVALDPNN